MGTATPTSGLEDVSLDNQEWKNSTTPVVTNGQHPSRFDVEVRGAVVCSHDALLLLPVPPPTRHAFANQPSSPPGSSLSRETDGILARFVGPPSMPAVHLW